MPDITFDCPECNESLVVDSKGAGQTVKCPKCSKPIQIPQDKTESPSKDDSSDELFVALDGLSTEELISIWMANDRKERTDQTFDIIKNILTSRNVPVSSPGEPFTYRQKTYGVTYVETKNQVQQIRGEVVVSDIRMSFWSMVVFMVKWAIAAIPAIIILFLIALFIALVMGGCLAGLAAAMFHGK